VYLLIGYEQPCEGYLKKLLIRMANLRKAFPQRTTVDWSQMDETPHKKVWNQAVAEITG
jgi:hypothetical protein